MDCIQNNQIDKFAMNFIIYGPHPPKIILHDMLNPIQMDYYIYAY